MIFDFIEIDRNKKEALFLQIYYSIKNAIISGSIEEGTSLPSIRQASRELEVSKTTIENAYSRLCAKGFLESKPQSSYIVRRPNLPKKDDSFQKNKKDSFIFDFSSGKTDINENDLAIWKRKIRKILNDKESIISYGEPQGEYELREAISKYSFSARGVVSTEENIVIGAGTQILLSLFCSLCDKSVSVAIAYPGFKQAERIFEDFGIKVIYIDAKSDIPLDLQLELSGAKIYIDIPSTRSSQTISQRKEERRLLLEWVRRKENRLIIEDDYNGELRYKARQIASIQALDQEKIIYLGSFSNLLLPSIRIAYMVLPKALMKIYKKRIGFYNQTASKIEQLALAEYIKEGKLEAHLKKLKKLYSDKYKVLMSAISNHIKIDGEIALLETSLTVNFRLKTKASDEKINSLAQKRGINLGGVREKVVSLNFSGIELSKIEDAIRELAIAWSEI